MRRSLIGLCLLALPLLSVAQVSFRNDREGQSYYQSRSHDRAIKRALKDLSENEIEGAFEDILPTLKPRELCSYEINETLSKRYKQFNPKFDQFEGAIYYLRSQNHFDDTVTKILLDAHKTTSTKITSKDRSKVTYPNQKILTAAIPLVKEFRTKFLNKACLDEAYRNFLSEINKIDENIKFAQLEGIFLEAYEQKVISTDDYIVLEQARQNEIQYTRLNLKSYYQKVNSLRLQYPLRDKEEQSNFVTSKADKLKMSYRQRLLENYSDIQIMLMGNIIKKLRSRLESPKVEILIYDRTDVAETIELEPMERFRLAIKLLRKEMSYLALNTYFNGQTPSYMDLMVASYELGIIPASEIEEIAGLQEIWNPTKTFWEKAKVWVQTLSSVATIVIPPPYGFIPALAIVVIEATTHKSKNPNENDPTSLF